MHTVVHTLLAAALSALLTIGALVTAPAATAAGGIVMYVDSAPGDTLGDGMNRIYTAGGTNANDGGNTVWGSAYAAGPDYWDVRFSAPTGQMLTAGTTYNFASTMASTTSGAMELSNGDLGTCEPASGSWFRVEELTAYTFAATFRYRCLGASGALYGYFGDADATTNVVAVIPSQKTVTFADTAVGASAPQLDVTVDSAGSMAATISSVTLGGSGVNDFAIESETCTAAPIVAGATCTIAVSFTPTVSGRLTATLTIDDDTLRGARTVNLVGTGAATASVVSWGTRYNAGPNYSWTYRGALARTATATTSYLHMAATTDRVNGTWADDNGPYMGVIYTRGNSGGSSWGTPFRVNSSGQHGDRAVIGSSGSYVYVAWSRIGRILSYSPTAPRPLYFRANSNHGAAGAWKSPVLVTSSTARTDSPSIATSGTSVYIAYTDAPTGAVRLAISRNRGISWTKIWIGSTTNKTSDGFTGLPSVAAAGSNVVVSWIAGGSLTLVARVSTNSATTFGSATTIATGAWSQPSAAARDTRIAVGWTAADGARIRTYAAGTWSATRKVGIPYGLGRAYVDLYSPAVAFGGSGQIGIAFAACWQGCTTTNSTTRVDLVWAESKDGGVTWFRSQLIGDANASSARRMNDAAAVVWPTSTKRVMAWNGYTGGTLAYRMYVRVASGAN